MATTYDATLATDKDWVRFLCGDRDVSSVQVGDRVISRARLQDEEIIALLDEEANRYFAAARACEVIYARTQGMLEKQVGDLKLKYGGNADDAYLKHIRALRIEGARRLQPKPRSFRVLSGR